MITVQGNVCEGWGRVADAFRQNFEDPGESGAACAVYFGGREVVNVWGGLADRAANKPWDADTIINVASTSKGATAICAHILVERGELELDAPVTTYWPEFGTAGKEDIPVRWLLSHQAGLPVLDGPLTFEEGMAWEPVIRALENQKPLWTPGTEHIYHAGTFGHLVGELVRRVSGKSLGTFFADEVVAPLGLSAWIGLPEEHEDRVAKPEHAPFEPSVMVPGFAKRAMVSLDEAAAWVEAMYGPGSVLSQAGSMGGIFDDPYVTEGRAYRAGEFPAGNMMTDARSLARMYAATVSEVDGVRLLQPDTITTATEIHTDRTTMHGAPPELAHIAARVFTMSLGFWRSSPGFRMTGPTGFGHPGSGGSIGFGDIDHQVGFGYVPGLWSFDPADPRVDNLAAAVVSCLE